MIFSDNSFTSSQRAVIRQAADRWQQVIVGNLPSVRVRGLGTVDDLVIYVSASRIDGVDSVLTQAGPTALRRSGSLSYLGNMNFDLADLPDVEASGKLFDLALHEMGHVLGFGTIGTNKKLLAGAGSTDPGFTGKNAVAEYRKIFNVNAVQVPVENTGLAGTRDAHWRRSVFGNELMVGMWTYNASMPLSRITVASFGDLGYVVNMNAADPYAKPASTNANWQVPQVSGFATGGIWALGGEHFGAHLAAAIQRDEAIEPALAPEPFGMSVAAVFPVNPPFALQPDWTEINAKVTVSAQGAQAGGASEESVWSISRANTAHLNNDRQTLLSIARLSSNLWQQAVDELFHGGHWFADDEGTSGPQNPLPLLIRCRIPVRQQLYGVRPSDRALSAADLERQRTSLPQHQERGFHADAVVGQSPVADLTGSGQPDIVIGGRWYKNLGDVIKGQWQERVATARWTHPDANVDLAYLNGNGRLRPLRMSS